MMLQERNFVVGTDTVCVYLCIGKFNGLNFYDIEIANAYLNPDTKEEMLIISVSKFVLEPE